MDAEYIAKVLDIAQHCVGGRACIHCQAFDKKKKRGCELNWQRELMLIAKKYKEVLERERERNRDALMTMEKTS